MTKRKKPIDPVQEELKEILNENRVKEDALLGDTISGGVDSSVTATDSKEEAMSEEKKNEKTETKPVVEDTLENHDGALAWTLKWAGRVGLAGLAIGTVFAASFMGSATGCRMENAKAAEAKASKK
jgi:hypothetical protein